VIEFVTRIRLGPQLVPPVATIERRYGLFSLPVIVETNEQALMEAADLSLGRFEVPQTGQPLRLRLFAVDQPWRGGEHWHVAYNTDGRFYALSTPDSMALADTQRGEAVAFVGRHMQAEIAAVRRELVEGLTIAMASAGRGFSPIHAAGIGRSGRGIALLGPAGAGKSTLTMAAARRGFDVFAEDAIYVKVDDHGPQFWGMPWIQRLLPEALVMFPELNGVLPRLQANGETKYEIDLDEWYPGQATPSMTPSALVLLAREPGPTRLTQLVDDDLAEVELLWPWGEAWTPDHQRAADLLAGLTIYRLEVGGTPEEALDALEAIFVAAPHPA
jgi:hypothetical protein